MKRKLFALVMALCLLISSASALTVEQAGELLKEYYIDEVPEEVLTQPTIKEMLSALGDPYTAYYNAEEYAAFMAAVEDTRLVGIGIQSYYRSEGVQIALIAPNSPAGEAGLQAGDYIIGIDGHDARGAAEADIDNWIHGEMGTNVTLSIQRGTETFEVTLIRREVVFPTVTLDKIENRIGWITCSAFGSTTFQYFYEIVTAHDEEVDEWVIDLRGNSGGDVLSALFSVGCFGGTGSGAYFRDGDGTYYGYLFSPDMITALGYFDGDLSAFSGYGYLTEDAAHVLVDENTASAAELFCAAIRDSGAGLIIGERTYGKGVAQTLLSEETEGVGEYFQDGDAMKITTERVYATQGGTYDHVGILPHFQVDADLADEVAALLAAPISEGETLLVLGNLSDTSKLVSAMAIPLSMVQAPEHAAAVEELLAAIPVTAYCAVQENGEMRQITLEEAAALAGVTLNRMTFADTENSDYYYEINTLGLYGIVNGVGDGSFRPDEELTRAALCALLAKALRCPMPDEAVTFEDVPVDAWYAPYVAALCEMGLIEGDKDGLFHPEEVVSHEQFLAILGRTAQWLDMDYYELSRHDGIYGDQIPSEEDLAERFGSFAEWARELVWLCNGGLVWADLSEVDAAGATTRAEAAAGVYNLMQMSGVIPG